MKLYPEEYQLFVSSVSLLLNSFAGGSIAKTSQKYLRFKAKFLIKRLSHALNLQNHKIFEMIISLSDDQINSATNDINSA